MKHYQIRQSITDRSSISVNLYLKEISKYPLLTPEKELELVKLIKSGDENAKTLLIKSNLRFVISIAKQYQNKGVDFADLIEYGNLGLIKAAEKFDETRGFKFISYAVWWIRQSILQALAEQSKIIRYPLNQIILLNKINSFTFKFEQQNERKPSIDEISEHLDVSDEKIRDLLTNMHSIISLDNSIDDGSEDCLADIIPGEEILQKNDNESSLSVDVKHLLQNLNSIEQIVVTQFFGIGCTPKYIDDIALSLNITKERTRQIKDKAILKLRKLPDINKLLKYFG